MVTCPEGHPSTATDYCDVCGTALGANPTAVEATAECAVCGAPIAGRFCEACGHDSALPPLSRAAETVVVAPAEEVAAQEIWTATVTADREFYERVQARKGPDADQVQFPSYYPPRRIALRGNDFLIGKRSVSQGVHPDIDLGIAPIDIGVSRAHARLRIDGDAITITDLGSTNGTSLDGSDDLIPADTPVPLADGARIHVGGWTTITVTRGPAAAGTSGNTSD
ncbi:FHA domain-containing protein [Nocardia sp. NPDC004068]|uniref:FHA domain-containing protein n=1 Tax=Nocardia sp. NPDC004068 TaxID=3364303 RepID=UPI00368EAE0B